MLRRRLPSPITAGIAFVARRPAIHALVKVAYPMVPGLRPFLRRFLPHTAAVTSPLAEIEAMLKFDRSHMTSGPSQVVTVEQLLLLARTH